MFLPFVFFNHTSTNLLYFSLNFLRLLGEKSKLADACITTRSRRETEAADRDLVVADVSIVPLHQHGTRGRGHQLYLVCLQHQEVLAVQLELRTVITCSLYRELVTLWGQELEM